MAPTEDQQRAEQSLQGAIDEFGKQLGEVGTSQQKLIDEVNKALQQAAFISPLGAWLFSKKVESAARKLAKRITELNETCLEFIEHATPVFSLIRVGFGWTNGVLPDLSGMAGTARDIRPNALHAWKGQAAITYQRKLVGQFTAVQGLSIAVRDTGLWLVSVAALNAKFFIDLTTPLIELVDSIIEAAAEIATVVGVLEAINTCADAVAGVATDILKIAQAAATHAFDSVEMLSQARTIHNDRAFFGDGGRWPEAVNR